MSSTSSTAGLSAMARDTAKDARDGVKEAAKAVSGAGSDMKSDLESLRSDVANLTQQLSDIVSSKGSAAWDRAKSNFDGVIADVGDKGQEAVTAVREVGDNVMDAIDESLKKRPYTTLAIAFGLGFLFGVMRR
jgi:ElaB/YqjD/DUF883 family membrane-anchored ribosome-binding protein